MPEGRPPVILPSAIRAGLETRTSPLADEWRVPRMVASDYPFLDVMWSIFIFFAWVIWIWLLITVLADVFRRHDISGWGKAAWTLFMIFLPLLGVLIYLISQGQGMAERSAKDQRAYQAQTEDYIKSVAGKGDPTDQIARGKELLDSGAITADEFEALKRKALAT
jgi:Phospholipase_D-nuclease N-terminal/Short C-terminal domain